MYQLLCNYLSEQSDQVSGPMAAILVYSKIFEPQNGAKATVMDLLHRRILSPVSVSYIQWIHLYTEMLYCHMHLIIWSMECKHHFTTFYCNCLGIYRSPSESCSGGCWQLFYSSILVNEINMFPLFSQAVTYNTHKINAFYEFVAIKRHLQYR